MKGRFIRTLAGHPSTRLVRNTTLKSLNSANKGGVKRSPFSVTRPQQRDLSFQLPLSSQSVKRRY